MNETGDGNNSSVLWFFTGVVGALVVFGIIGLLDVYGMLDPILDFLHVP